MLILTSATFAEVRTAWRYAIRGCSENLEQRGLCKSRSLLEKASFNNFSRKREGNKHGLARIFAFGLMG